MALISKENQSLQNSIKNKRYFHLRDKEKAKTDKRVKRRKDYKCRER